MHDITINANGTAEAMFYRQPAWHGLGQVVEEAPTSEAAIGLAGLDWDVNLEPVYRRAGDKFIEVPDKSVSVRSDNGTALGVVGGRYHVLQNRDAFRWVDGLVDNGDVRYEAAGSLRGGRMVWMLARLAGGDDKVVDGDTIRKYLLLHNSHDGGGSVVVTPTAVRVVCANTLLMADPLAGRDGDKTKASAAKHTLRISHTKSMSFKLEDARRVLGLLNGKFVGYTRAARELAAAKFSDAQFNTFLDKLVPLPELGRVTEYRRNARERIADIYRNAPTTAMIRGTAWAAVNAVTEFIDHEWDGVRSEGQKGAERRLYAVWHGTPAKFKADAHRYAARLAGVDLSVADSYRMADDEAIREELAAV